MAEATYPLLARRRSRRRSSITVRPRVIAVALIVAALVPLAVVVALRPPSVDAAALLTTARQNLVAGNYSAARSNAQRAIAAQPASVPAHLILAQAYLHLGNGAAAQAMLAGLPPGRTHALIADALLLQGDPAAALAEAAKAAPCDADHAERIAARATAAQGDVAAAQAMLVEVVSRNPRDAAAWTDLGRLRLTAAELGGAAEAAMIAARLVPGEPAALVLQGEMVRARYGLVAALPWFEAALKRDAYYPPALVEAAATLGDLGRNTEALALTRRLLAVRPGDARAYYLQAVIAARAGDTDLARRLLQASGGSGALPGGGRLLDGVLDYAQGRFEQAAAKWRRLAADQPLSIGVRRLLASALLRSGDAAGALAAIRPIAVRADADGYSLIIAARAFGLAGNTAAAARMLDRVATAGGVAEVFASDLAVGTLRAGAAGASTDPSYALGVMRGLLGVGDRAGAIATAQALVTATPGSPAAQMALGDTLAADGRQGEAIAAFSRAASLRFDEPAMLRQVEAQGRAGRRIDAARTLALYLSQQPQSVAARRLLAAWQVEGGQLAAAIETLEELRRQLGNRDAGLLAALALAYAGEDEGEVAVRYARAAYRLQPMSARVADAYGVALAAAGDADGARQLLDKAATLAPGDRAIAAHRRQLG